MPCMLLGDLLPHISRDLCSKEAVKAGSGGIMVCSAEKDQARYFACPLPTHIIHYVIAMVLTAS